MAAKPILMYLSYGHWIGVDPGAVSGKFVEAKINFKYMTACYRELFALRKKYGYNYKITFPEKSGRGMSLRDHVNDIRRYRKKYRVVAVDGHMNAGGGIGAEVIINPNDKYEKYLAECILAELHKAGFDYHAWDGKRATAIHKDPSFTFLKAGGVNLILEPGFIDNKSDRKRFDTDKEIEAMGKAVARGMVNYYKKYR